MPQGGFGSKAAGSAVAFVLATLAFLCAAGVRAQEQQVAVAAGGDDATLTANAVGRATLLPNPGIDVDRLAQAFERGLMTRWHSYCPTADSLVRDFHFWQRFLLPIAPPAAGSVFYAQRSSLRVFDPAGFPPEMVAGLEPESYHDIVYVYRVTVCEDPTTRERVFYNASSNEVWRQAAPENYDPWQYLRMVHPGALELATGQAMVQTTGRAFRLTTAYAQQLVAIYDPARIRCEYLLLPTDSLSYYATCCAIEASSRARERALNPPAMMMSMYTPASGEFVFTDLIVTDGVVDAGIHLPDNTSCRVDLFYKESLLDPWWGLAMTTPTNTGTFRIQFACSLSNAFFRAGNADTDADGDGIPDDRELLMYGSSPASLDTDGDGISDYDEIFTYHTDPAKRDTDGDGMDDGWEVAHGHNPLDPNDPPNVSGTIVYSGRQTGAVWVVAVTSSNSWATNNAVLVSGPGAYLIPNLSGGSYYLKAWMDSASNGAPDATEAFGVFTNNPVCVTNRVAGNNIVLLDPDADSDGLPDWWEVQHFGSITNWTGSGDPDGDQYTNLEEYNAGTDPTNVASHPRTISGTIAYSGPQTGTIHVIASASSAGWTGIGSTTLSAPGAYTITHLPPDASYWIKAYRDSAGQGTNIFWEAQGTCTNNPVYLNASVTNADVTLTDPDHDGDGLPDWWEVKYGLDPFHPGVPDGAWWKLDESSGATAQDSSGNANAGTLQGMDTNAWTDGVISNALSFNGATGYVQVADSASLKPHFVSVALWVKPSQDMTSGSAVFFTKKQPGAATGYQLSYEQGALSFLVCASGSRTVSLPFTLASGVWHHVVGTYGGNNHRLYVDGILRSGTNYDWGLSSGYINQGATAPRIGATTDATPTNFFAGAMDDVRVYGRELASNEVHAVYEIGADPDGDGLSNWREYQSGGSPYSADTDGDGMPDAWEVAHGLNPADPLDAAQDADLDGLSNLQEYEHGTDPNKSDTDEDGLSDYQEVTAGRVYCWGDIDYGLCNPPADLTNVVSVAAGAMHALALRADGTVVAWGYTDAGACSIPEGLDSVVAIAAGLNYSLALKSDGTVVAWGCYDDNNPCYVPSNATGIVAVAAGWYHTVALRADGCVICWGSDTHHQCEVPDDASNNVVAISAGAEFTLALRSDGRVVGWGHDDWHQRSFPSNIGCVTAIAAGCVHSIALLADTTVCCIGDNWHGDCVPPSGLSNVVAVAAGYNQTMALRSDGSVVCWGNNDHGQCSPTNTVRAAAISAGTYFCMALLRPDPTKFDTDGDGLSDGWEVANGLDPSRTGDATRDDDNDGLDNAAEFALGGRARVPDLGLGVAVSASSDGMHSFSWPAFPGISNYLVTVALNGAVAFSNVVAGTGLALDAPAFSGADGVISVTALNSGRPCGRLSETWRRPAAGTALTLWKLARNIGTISNACSSGTVLLDRTLEVNRQGTWDKFLVSASPDAAQSWDIQGARLELDGLRAVPPPANACWQMPSATNAVTIEARMVSEATNGVMAVAGPVYLLKWSPTSNAAFDE